MAAALLTPSVVKRRYKSIDTVVILHILGMYLRRKKFHWFVELVWLFIYRFLCTRKLWRRSDLQFPAFFSTKKFRGKLFDEIRTIIQIFLPGCNMTQEAFTYVTL